VRCDEHHDVTGTSKLDALGCGVHLLQWDARVDCEECVHAGIDAKFVSHVQQSVEGNFLVFTVFFVWAHQIDEELLAGDGTEFVE
jgi:hypothetical protein